jgi:hypothetical protein
LAVVAGEIPRWGITGRCTLTHAGVRRRRLEVLPQVRSHRVSHVPCYLRPQSRTSRNRRPPPTPPMPTPLPDAAGESLATMGVTDSIAGR